MSCSRRTVGTVDDPTLSCRPLGVFVTLALNEAGQRRLGLADFLVDPFFAAFSRLLAIALSLVNVVQHKTRGWKGLMPPAEVFLARGMSGRVNGANVGLFRQSRFTGAPPAKVFGP